MRIIPLFLGILVFSLGASGASYTGTYTITQIVVDADRYAGCMLKLNPNPTEQFPNCSSGFASLGCDGTGGVAKSEASQLLNNASLAFAMGKQVTVRLNDENYGTTARGYCFADRIDVRR